MDPHQERVLEEAAELGKRMERLLAFTLGPVFQHLHPAEQDRMSRQLGHMGAYHNVLLERIAAWGATA
jgi:hypothetical protein